MNGLLVATGCAAAAGTAAIGAYVGLVRGRLTIDLGIGRRTRPLGPLHLDIAAPRETVYAAAAAPYAGRQPRAMQEKVEILERAGQMVHLPGDPPRIRRGSRVQDRPCGPVGPVLLPRRRAARSSW